MVTSANDFARYLRKNQTDAESRLWHSLSRRQPAHCRFRRQAPVGPYIVDFVCFEQGSVIELDGGQHIQRSEADEVRTRWLRDNGLRVLRF